MKYNQGDMLRNKHGEVCTVVDYDFELDEYEIDWSYEGRDNDRFWSSVDLEDDEYFTLIELTKTNSEEVRVVDPVTGGEKGRKLEEFAYVPIWPRQEVARVYGMGAAKYSPNNWRKGYAWSLSISALYRHIGFFEAGESIDPESGLHHLAHAIFHLNTLMTFEREGLGTDDRHPDKKLKEIYNAIGDV